MEVKLDSASHTILSEDDTMGSGNSVEVCLLVTGCFERNVTVDLATSPITAVYGITWCYYYYLKHKARG